MTAIHFAGSDQDTLTLGAQHLAGGLAVSVTGAGVATEEVTVDGALAIRAPSITVDGALRAAAVALNGSQGVNIEAGGAVSAGQTDTGGRVDVTTARFVNAGQIRADGPNGGRVVVQAENILNAGPVTANALGNGDGGLVQMAFTGTYEATVAGATAATAVAGHGGRVLIDGGSTGRLYSSGPELATGRRGGSVDLLGHEVVLAAATVDASGDAGGGSIRVGGDYQGRNPNLVNAQAVTVTATTTLRASATDLGDGGRVIVWADGETTFAGTASARGGLRAGSGGFIEISGRNDLRYSGRGDAAAAAGAAGQMLLDPKNIVIAAAPDGVYPQYALINPHPNAGGQFGNQVTVLGNGNIVVTDPLDDLGGSSPGATYLFQGATGALISSLLGTYYDFHTGFHTVTVLSNGNYVIQTPAWMGTLGAVTWASAATGVSGTISATNSLVGSVADDRVDFDGVLALPGGNYVVGSELWNGIRGAVTWGNGTTGVRGTVSAANSLVGGTAGDQVGSGHWTVLANGNFLVQSPTWNGGSGAITFVNAAYGLTGTVTAFNSLVGTDLQDHVGSYGTITTLNDSNYLVLDTGWNRRTGSLTWGSGTAGVSGAISSSNSLVGASPNDQIGSGGLIFLTNGNYVLDSPYWNNERGAVTWISRAAGLRGEVSSANSLVGSSVPDFVGYYGILPLNNGNYLVNSPSWNHDRGAVTWADGTAGVRGEVSSANSLVGSDPGDRVAGASDGLLPITPLSNGDYVVRSPTWSGSRGAVTWGNGATGITGQVSAANSLVGSDSLDVVGANGVRLLTNGNYVVVSRFHGRGAVTWESATASTSGVVSADNSLVGTTPGDGYTTGDRVGTVIPLTNGNYVVSSPYWNSSLGAATWANGTTGIAGAVSSENSLVGTNAYDSVSSGGVYALSNGNYVVDSRLWNGTRGAVTWGNGTGGLTGAVSPDNSLVGSNPGDYVGGERFFYGIITLLSNGNYLISSPAWNGGRGAVTWAAGTAPIIGTLSAANSLVGTLPTDGVGSVYEDTSLQPPSNGNYLIRTPKWNGNRGAVTWANGRTGVRGEISSENSLVGSDPNDYVGGLPDETANIFFLSSGNYVVLSEGWSNDRGAVTWGDGTTGVTGEVSAVNSLVGTNPGDYLGVIFQGSGITLLSNGNYLVRSAFWNAQRGALTWASGATGVTGPVSEANSLLGSAPNDRLGQTITILRDGNIIVSTPAINSSGAATWVSSLSGQTLDGQGHITAQNSLLGPQAFDYLGGIVDDTVNHSFLAPFQYTTAAEILVGLNDPNQLTYPRAEAQSVTITPDFLARTLSTGTDVVLQASNDIMVDDPIRVNAGGHGGALTLQAGRSIIVNADVTTDNGPLTLIANDTAANGVVDARREAGAAFIDMAGGTTLDTGSAPLNVALRNGAGLTHSSSRTVNLQTLSAGSVTISNNGPSAGSDVRLSGVTTSGPQSYASPQGRTVIAGNLTAADQTITFTDSVAVDAGAALAAGTAAIVFAGSGAQTLQAGSGASFGNVEHSGSGTLQLASPVQVFGSFTNSNGTFDAHDQSLTVSASATVTGGMYLAGTATQNFLGGLLLSGGVVASSSGPMTINGPVVVLGGSLQGEGGVGPLTAINGTVTPASRNPGILTAAGSVAFFPELTFLAQLNGLTPGTEYSQLVTAGPIYLGGSILSLTLGFEPPVGSSFEILAAGGGGVTGTFAGLPEGSTFRQDGVPFQITYHGGPSGTSVILTRIASGTEGTE